MNARTGSQQGQSQGKNPQKNQPHDPPNAGEGAQGALADQPGMQTDATGPGVNIGLEADALTKVVQGLQTLLADEVLLYVKTRNFHWNVEGPDFSELHKLFEEQYEQLDEVMDEVAERIRVIGGYSAGSMQEFLQLATLKEVPGGARTEGRMEQRLLDDHEQMARRLREFAEECGDVDDFGTQDFVTGVMQAHEKMAWMLRSYARRPMPRGGEASSRQGDASQGLSGRA
jgi:starvation-inducible DNA-binding protein